MMTLPISCVITCVALFADYVVLADDDLAYFLCDYLCRLVDSFNCSFLHFSMPPVCCLLIIDKSSVWR